MSLKFSNKGKNLVYQKGTDKWSSTDAYIYKEGESHIDLNYKNIVIFFHENCQDGEVARIVVLQGLRGLGCKTAVRSIGRSYQKAYSIDTELGSFLETESQSLIFYVDFAPTPEELQKLSMHNLVVVLDHHETARKLLKVDEVANLSIEHCLENGPMVGSMIVLDNSRSGAGVAWDFFHPNTPRPELVNLVEDRDLWNFKLEGSRELAFLLQNMPPENWVDFFERFNQVVEYRDRFIKESKIYYVETQEEIKRLSDKSNLFKTNHGVSYRIVESSAHHSDLANKILEDNPNIDFAIVMVNKGDGNYKLSFRSEDRRMNVSLICERFGGGGHRNASGMTFKLSEGELVELEILKMISLYLDEMKK